MDFEKYKKINENPSRLGILEDFNATGRFHNEGCGDDYEIFLKIENSVIVDAKFKTTGCGFGLAALQLTLDAVIGKTCSEARALDPETVSEAIGGFPPGRYHYIKEAHVALCDALNKAES
jgi:nitrogen fixation NifU-like protein